MIHDPLTSSLVVFAPQSPATLQKLRSRVTTNNRGRGGEGQKYVPFRYSFASVDVFQELLRFAAGLGAPGQDDSTPPERHFETYLGNLLSLSSTTFLEVPEWPALRLALDLLAPLMGSSIEERYKSVVPDSKETSLSSEDALRLILGGATKAANLKATMRFTSSGNDFADAKAKAKYLFDREYGDNGIKSSSSSSSSSSPSMSSFDMSHALAKAITSLKSASFTRIIRIDAVAAAQLGKNGEGSGEFIQIDR